MVLSVAGVAEILFGVLLLWRWHSRPLLLLNIGVLGLLGLGALPKSATEFRGSVQSPDSERCDDRALPYRFLGRSRPAERAFVPTQETGGTGMTSIYQEALGADFCRLHPKMQERFGLAARTASLPSEPARWTEFGTVFCILCRFSPSEPGGALFPGAWS